MATVFPGALDNITSNKTDTTAEVGDHAPHHNLLADALNAVQKVVVGPTWYNAKGDGGALGDGLTVDTTALQTLLNKKGNLYLPPGTYLVDNYLTVSAASRIVGAGHGITTIKRKSGVLQPVIRSATFSTGITPGTGDVGIEISDLTIDGNGTTQQNNTHTIWLTGTLRPRLRNLRLIGGTNFAISLQCCKSGIVENIHCESSNVANGLDGVHLWDSSEFVVRDIKGNTGDDLVSITSSSYDVSGILIDGVVGQSSGSRVLNLEVAATGRTLSSVRVLGLIAEASAAASISLAPSSGGTMQDIDIDWITLATSSRALYINGAGVVNRARFRGTIQGPQGAGVEMVRSPVALTDCEFAILFNNVVDGQSMMLLDLPTRCKVSAMGDYVNSGKASPQAIIWLGQGSNNEVTHCNVKGGAQFVKLASTGVALTNTAIHHNVIDGPSTNVLLEQGNATANRFTDNLVTNAPGTPAVLAAGSTTFVARNTAPVTENGGTKAITGDGATTTFTIAHGLVSTPATYSAVPQEDPGSRTWLTVDPTNITIHYQTAPGAGTYHWGWRAAYMAGA